MAKAAAYTLPERRAHVMGILNVTPDSFSDGGRFDAADAALDHARSMIADGADILDIGAESTRPGSEPVGLEDEWSRLAPVLEPVCELGCPVSIDTYKAEIVRRAGAAGAAIVNDVWGLQKDPAMADTVAELGVPVVMMHNRDHADADIDILADMDRFFETSMALAERAGIAKEKQILDPGFGFGKTIDQNFLILNRLETLQKHGLPILAGASRKRMIGAVLGVETDERLFGSIAVHMTAVIKGAAILRVHDVRPHADCVRISQATRLERNPV
ncbi:dihydropteroate synthase [Roseibium alexandrii]|uniref:Dihydropteroate synthase n=1 Tax=Roseibium alexandrii (strain DSM 17067 / NCIMB 14079 / DFL-11) TaxID=244592 RepID=A0A5E8H5E5_ROSAD|nr:dihydropteroate synthase [Roseibium alexandrii]EEE47708.2 dihydropteroate synthase [Roseibium alexandrii DFL-11]